VSLLVLEDIEKSFHSGNEIIKIIDAVSMRVEQHEHVAIMGPSGSGKTTLMQLVCGLQLPDKGNVFIGGEYINQMTEYQRLCFRKNHIGFVFQDYGLLDGLSALENVLLAADPMLSTHQTLAHQLLEDLGLESRIHTKASVLSGGEKQRVAIARALLNKPTLILADEPTAQLDRTHVTSVMELLCQMQKQYGLTLLTVTHDAAVAAFADRTIQVEML
jgi:ABC-type lipoprotein export system ATPase subunit